MTRKCFFLEKIDTTAGTVVLDEETSRHIQTVLRARAGEEIELRDGLGNGWRGMIAEVKGKAVRVRLIDKQDIGAESPLDLTLALAFARLDRMELVLRQATELGVNRVVAFRAARSQYGLRGTEADRRRERWVKITREALCQCGRARVPDIRILSDASEFLADALSHQTGEAAPLKMIALEEGAGASLPSLWRDQPLKRAVIAVVGPEGGWTEEEAVRFREAGFCVVHLGPRILRLETAATAFVAAIQLLWGDFQ